MAAELSELQQLVVDYLYADREAKKARERLDEKLKVAEAIGQSLIGHLAVHTPADTVLVCIDTEYYLVQAAEGFVDVSPTSVLK